MNETVTQTEAPIDIVAMMAREGVKTDDSPVNYAPVQNTNPQSEEVKEPAQAEPAKPETSEPASGPRTESVGPQPEIVKPEPAAAPVAPVQSVDVDWRELVKKQSEVEVLKHLGLDEKMINFLSRWRGGEDLKDYLEAVTTDYSKLSPEQLLRQQLYKEFGSLSAEDFEEVYKMKVVEQYKLDPDLYDEKEIRRGKLLLGIDAERVRQDFIKKQQDLLLSKPPEPVQSAAELEAIAQAEQREKDMQAYRGHVDSNTYTKDLINTRLLKIGEGDKAFNLEVSNPKDVIDLLYDPSKWAQKLWNNDGTPNVRKQLILGAIAYDDTAFFTNLAKHYETLGAKTLADQLQNASEPAAGTPSKGSAESSNPISQLARYGTITSGD